MSASDNPIRSSQEDSLGRAVHAGQFSRQLVTLDASEGVVVGVLGPWGSGKTSYINLVRQQLLTDDIAVIDFNPWMFSGAEQLVNRFFVELGEELKLKPGLADVGEKLEDYGELFGGLGWLPLAGPWIERGRALTKMAARLAQRRQQGSRSLRERLTEALQKLTTPIVVILDDIDRLSTPEIREIFKLVRLTASLPQIIYVVAFDRARVEQALDEDGVPGRAYLEKILQLAVDLPVVPARVLQVAITDAIQRAIADAEDFAHFDTDAWQDTFIEVIAPLISTMRDVRRYEAAVAITVPSMAGHVDLGDALALEAVRVFLPNVYAAIAAGVDGLTSTANFGYGMSEPPQWKAQVEAIVAAAGDHGSTVRDLIRRLFPAGIRQLGENYHPGDDSNAGWLKQRRVANRDVLRYVLERTIGDELDAYLLAERAFEISDDADQLTGLLMSTPAARREDVLREMPKFADSYAKDSVAATLTALHNVLPTLPDQRRGMFGTDSRFAVTRMTYLLLRNLAPDEVEQVAREVLPNVDTLWGRYELITSIGHRENAGHKFVDADVAAAFETEWRQLVRATAESDLLAEIPLLNLLWRVRHEAADDEPPLVLGDSDAMTVALLRSAVAEVRSNAMGNRAVSRDARLNWEMLVTVVGGESELRKRIDALRADAPEDLTALIELCDRYLAGWRPDF